MSDPYEAALELAREAGLFPTDHDYGQRRADPFFDGPNHAPRRVTRAVRIRSATLDRVPAEEVEEVAETETQLAHRAAYELTNVKRFEQWGTYSSRSKNAVVGDLTFDLVKVIADSRDRDSYDGEYPMGSEGVIGLIFKVTASDGRVLHLKKEGYADSYGRESWDGPLRVVTPTTKTVVEYVY